MFCSKCANSFDRYEVHFLGNQRCDFAHTFQKYRWEIPRHTNVVLDPILKTQISKYWRILLLCKIVASWPPFSQEWKKYPTTMMHCGASAKRLNVYCLRVRDCCECFVYKYTHALIVRWTRNFNTARGEAECSIENFEYIVRSASAYICRQNTNFTVSTPDLIYKKYPTTMMHCGASAKKLKVYILCKFNFSICRLVKTVSCAGPQNVILIACLGDGATGQQ
jgi:hypothetical protein